MADVHRPSWNWLLFGPNWRSSWLICLGVGLHAMNWFMAVTVMPTVAKEMDAVPLISWATTVFLVCSIIGGASGGRLKIRYGARRLLTACTFVFLAGTLLAAAASDMPMLLVGRALQGASEGIILAVSYALVRELFAATAIPRAFGLLAVVYAVGAAFGPLAAGVLVELAGWRIAFLMNLPFAAVYLWLLSRVLTSADTSQTEPAGTFGGGRLALIGTAAIGVCLASLAETALHIVTLLVAAAFCFAASIALDRRSLHRLFPSGSFTLSTPVAFGLWVALLLPAASAGVHVYAPYLIQEVGGNSAIVAGYFGALTAIGWSTAAILVTRVPQHRASVALLVGPAIVAATVLATGWLFSDRAGVVPLAVCLMLVGIGFGTCWAFLAQRTQAAAEVAERDLAAGATPTLQSAGGALGAAIAGLLANLGGLGDYHASGAETTQAVADAAWWVFSGGAAVAALATLASLALVISTRDLVLAEGVAE